MARALLFLVPRGNSQAIHTLPDDIQGEVSRFYIEVFAMWEGRTYPYILGLLGPLGVLAGLLSLGEAATHFPSQDAWGLALVCYLIAFLISRRGYRAQVREAEERLSELIDQSPDPDRIIKVLHEVDPMRTRSLNVRRKEVITPMDENAEKVGRRGQDNGTTCLVLTYNGSSGQRTATGTAHHGPSTRRVHVSVSDSGAQVMTSHPHK